MKKMAIYEPAMCCETGICGVSIDPELLRISTVLNTLKKNGIEVKRSNLSSAPMEFITCKVINDLLNKDGIDVLPAVVLDDAVIITGRYPSNEEFIQLLNLTSDILDKEDAEVNINNNSGGCCEGGCC